MLKHIFDFKIVNVFFLQTILKFIPEMINSFFDFGLKTQDLVIFVNGVIKNGFFILIL